MSSERLLPVPQCPPPAYLSRRSLFAFTQLACVYFCLFLFILFLHPFRVVDVQEEHWTEEVEANEPAAVSGR